MKEKKQQQNRRQPQPCSQRSVGAGLQHAPTAAGHQARRGSRVRTFSTAGQVERRPSEETAHSQPLLRQGLLLQRQRLNTSNLAKVPGQEEAAKVLNQAQEGSGCRVFSYKAFLQSGGAD